MKILAWYSFIIVALAVVGVGANLVNPDIIDKSSSYWGLVMFLPVLYFMFKEVTKEK